MTSTSKIILQKVKNFDQVFSISYLVFFLKKYRKAEILALINSKSKINVINSDYAAKLSFYV